MAPRRRTVASSAGAQAASLASLPDALLERILGLLERWERHRAALVSRRWHAAAHAPGLLHEVRLGNGGSSTMAKLPSLTAWLLRHGRHVRSLRINCFAANNIARMAGWELAGCLTACAAAAAGSLQQLSLVLSGDIALCVASWCAALRQLRSLDLSAGYSGQLHIGSSLAGLTALTRLSLSGRNVSVDAAAQLPPGVEQLKLQDLKSMALPSQLSALTRISQLVLEDMTCPPGGFVVLTSLGRLARLALIVNSHLPACLPLLTSLEELYLDQACRGLGPAEAVDAVNEALPHLTGLTSLCILDVLERRQPPAALAGLSRLQRCCLGSAAYEAVELEGPPTPLPPGPWAASLRELGASLDVLPHSLAVLSAATQLTRLALTGGSYKHSNALWEWARSHPPLRQLQIEIQDGAELTANVLHAICSLIRERPELTVSTSDDKCFCIEFDLDF